MPCAYSLMHEVSCLARLCTCTQGVPGGGERTRVQLCSELLASSQWILLHPLLRSCTYSSTTGLIIGVYWKTKPCSEMLWSWCPCILHPAALKQVQISASSVLAPAQLQCQLQSFNQHFNVLPASIQFMQHRGIILVYWGCNWVQIKGSPLLYLQNFTHSSGSMEGVEAAIFLLHLRGSLAHKINGSSIKFMDAIRCWVSMQSTMQPNM
jgi:hypothetical protein